MANYKNITINIATGDLQAVLTAEELLRRTDWTQLPDSPLTDSKKTEWRTYRQALRDLPTHSNWPELDGTEWPTPPS